MAALVWVLPLNGQEDAEQVSFSAYTHSPPSWVQPMAAHGPVVTQEPAQQVPSSVPPTTGPRQRSDSHSLLEEQLPPAATGARQLEPRQVPPGTHCWEVMQLVLQAVALAHEKPLGHGAGVPSTQAPAAQLPAGVRVDPVQLAPPPQTVLAPG
jgi:hypothetical protein